MSILLSLLIGQIKFLLNSVAMNGGRLLTPQFGDLYDIIDGQKQKTCPTCFNFAIHELESEVNLLKEQKSQMRFVLFSFKII